MMGIGTFMSRLCVKHSIHMISFNPYNHPDFIDEKQKHGIRVGGGAAGGQQEMCPGSPDWSVAKKILEGSMFVFNLLFYPHALQGQPGVGPIA